MSVLLTFLGAAREVTGSCMLVQASGARFLVDCGMFQGGEEADRKNSRPFPVPLSSIDFVLSTHAHLDHSGLLPKIVRDGFRGPVYATSATADLLKVMLPDSGHIQEREAEWQTRRALRAGRRDGRPLYTEADALAVFPLLKPVPYGEEISPAPGIRARFLDAGHILGSAIVSVSVRDDGREKTLVFSGDLGQRGLPIVQDPTPVEQADVLVIVDADGQHDTEQIPNFIKAIMDGYDIYKGAHVEAALWTLDQAMDMTQLNASSIPFLIWENQAD